MKYDPDTGFTPRPYNARMQSLQFPSISAAQPERRIALRWLGAGAGSLLLAGCDVGGLSDLGKAGGLPSAKFNSLDISGGKYAKDFSLLDMNGQRRTVADFRGKVVGMFFGYTQCPDVCPTTLTEMVQVKQLLGADADRFQVIFVTVDPERDTPALLKEYMANFGPDFLALVPTQEELRKTIAPGFRVYYKKVPGSQPEHYTMDHTAGTLLIDKQGRMRLHSNYGAKPELVAADVKALLAEE